MFWINNDYDVVNNSGVVDPSIAKCPGSTGEGNRQVCQQWDEIPNQNGNFTNTSLELGNRSRIETERDLEDFQPLLVSLPLETNEEGIPQLGVPGSRDSKRVFFRASGVNINLYRGFDLTPKFSTMTTMRFPVNLSPRRSQNEEALHRRTNHQGHQGA